MRTFDLTLQTDADVARIAAWAMPDEILQRGEKAIGTTYDILYDRAGTLSILIWACTPENEPYGLKLAQAYADRMNKYLEIYQHVTAFTEFLWTAAHEFSAPRFPSALRDTYPEAIYDDEHPISVPEEADWYQRWYPRRDYCRKISDILYG